MIRYFNKFFSYIPNANILQLLILILFFLICYLIVFNMNRRPKYYYKYMQGLPLDGMKNTNNEN